MDEIEEEEELAMPDDLLNGPVANPDPVGHPQNPPRMERWALEEYVKQAALEGVKLTLAPVQITTPNCTYLDISQVTAHHLNLQGCLLSHARFQDGDYTGSHFGVDLEYALFTNAMLAGATFRGANLSAASFLGATLTRADLRESQCQWTKFCGANLRGADFRGALLHGADFTDATWDETTRWEGSVRIRCVGLPSGLSESVEMREKEDIV